MVSEVTTWRGIAEWEPMMFARAVASEVVLRWLVSFRTACTFALVLPLGFGVSARGADVTNLKNSVGEVIANGVGFESHGTGVLLSPGNSIVTNLHVVAATREIRFRPEGSQALIELKAIAVWPDLDLVCLEAKSGAAAFRDAGMLPMEVSKQQVEAGMEVYAAGYPRGLGYSVSKGVVSGVRVFSELPDPYRRGWNRRPSSRWIQTDCPINPGNSGGPLVNAAGQLIGINTWGSRIDNDIYFALLGADVVEAIASPSGSPAAEEPVAAAGRGIDLERLGHSTFQQVEMPGTAPGSTGYLQFRGSPGCEFLIDGERLCEVPPEGGTLIVSHLPLETRFVIQLRKDGFATAWKAVTIPEGGVLAEQLAIGRPLPTELLISTVPADCQLAVQGPSTGVFQKQLPTQVFADLPPGDYTVRAEREGRVVEVKVKLDCASPVVVTMNLLDGQSQIRNVREPVSACVYTMRESLRSGRRSTEPRVVVSYGGETFGLFEVQNTLFYGKQSAEEIWDGANRLLRQCLADGGMPDIIPYPYLRLRVTIAKSYSGYMVDVQERAPLFPCRRLAADVAVRLSGEDFLKFFLRIAGVETRASSPGRPSFVAGSSPAVTSGPEVRVIDLDFDFSR